jgi:hypothetical protein
MPAVYTFPTTIYAPSVVNAPFTNDEIECNIDPPTPEGTPAPAAGEPPLHLNNWRAWLKLKINVTNGWHAGTVSITVPRSILTLDMTVPNPLLIGATTVQPVTLDKKTAAGNATATWTFASAAQGTYLFYVDFTPPPPPTPALTASFDAKSNELATAANYTETFQPQ